MKKIVKIHLILCETLIFTLNMFFILLCCCLAALLCQGVLGVDYLRVKNTQEFIQFSKNVSSGTSYSGTTVLLDADIDFSGPLSEQFEPIGKDNNYFQGTFNGQDHTISNLSMNSSLKYTGLFGYLSGGTIRNVVLDSSCSFVSYCNDQSWTYIGGIIGQCYGCVIENTVNMASVAFTGNTTGSTGNLWFGGIAGSLSTSSNAIAVRNCANYGSITHSGIVPGSSVSIGGIVGSSSGDSNKAFIQNCLNYGTITHNGTSGTLYIGGILGSSSGTNIENCVSGGKITSNKASNYIGSVVGDINSSEATIKHCHWTSDVGNYSAYGYGSQVTDTETKQAILNTTTVDSLNSYNSSWDKWLMLHLNGGNINNLNQTSLVVTQKHFPDPVKEGNAFLFWCLDIDCNEKYNPKSTDITKVTELYAVWNISTVLFVFGNGTTATKNVVYGQKYGTLPESASRTGHTFLGWFTEEEAGKGEKVTDDDIMKNIFDFTLYAQWIINNDYTITFDYGNGTVTNKTLKYNETINYPENPTREGCVFNGWVPRPERMTANDTTVVAQWIENATSEVIKIVFSKKDMTKDEVTEIIKGFTKENFTIKEIGTNENGSLVVIIRFDNSANAKNFVDAISGNDNSNNLFIESISFLSELPQDMATGLQLPSLFFFSFILILLSFK